MINILLKWKKLSQEDKIDTAMMFGAAGSILGFAGILLTLSLAMESAVLFVVDILFFVCSVAVLMAFKRSLYKKPTKTHQKHQKSSYIAPEPAINDRDVGLEEYE